MTEKQVHVDTANLDNFKELLANFKEPRRGNVKIPYVVFGRWSRNWTFDESLQQHTCDNRYTLHVQRCHVGAPPLAKLQYYKNKGWQVLQWWFPTHADLPPKTEITESGWVASMRGDETDIYSEARAWCEGAHAAVTSNNEVLQENSKLKEELEKLKAEKAKAIKDGNKSTTGASQTSMDGKPSAKK